MSDLMSIGASAVRVYQRALGTVSNNIANMDSEGYTRRLSNIQEAAPRMEANSAIGTGAIFQGVQRAYDSFLESSVRDAASELGEKSKFVVYTDRLLDLLGNDDATLMAAMDDFFAAAKAVANDPASLIMRSEFLAEAETLASRFTEISSQIEMIEIEALSDLDALVTDVNGLAEQLGVINKQLQKKGELSKQSPDLLDQRDQILRDLSELIPIKVGFDKRGVVTVSATNSLTAGLIVDEKSSYTVEVQENNSGVSTLMVDPFGKADLVPIVETGEIGGVIGWQTQILQPAYKDLDKLAMVIVDSVNEIQEDGLDLFGDMGGPMFRIDPVFDIDQSAISSPISIRVEIQDAGALELNEVTAEYVETDDGLRWKATDLRTSAEFFSNGAGVIEMNGVLVRVSGQPSAADTFTLTPATRPAAGINMVIDDPRRVAASGLFRVIGASTNLSESEATLDYSLQSLSSTDVGALTSRFSGTGADHEATSFTASFYEPIGYLGAGLSNVVISNEIDPNYPSSVQVFTRDGRQILGQALDDEQATTLIRESSGFISGATYSSDYLNHTASSPYRDMSVFYGFRAEASSSTLQRYVTNERTGEKTLFEFDQVNSARIETGPIEPVTNSTGADLEVVAAFDVSLQGTDLPALKIGDGKTLDAATVSTWVNQHAIDKGLALTARVVDRIEAPVSNLKLTGPRGPGLTINGTAINSGQGFSTSVELLDAINAKTATTNVFAFIDTRGVLSVTNTPASSGKNIEIGRGNSPYGNALGVRTGTHTGRLVIEETGFHNGDLSEGNPGDTVIAGFSTTTSRVIFGTTMLGGSSTPIDETYTTENMTLGLRDSDVLETTGTVSIKLAEGSVDGTDGNVIMLTSSGMVSSNENAVVRGPAIETNAAVALRAGDQIQFNWKAEGGEDAYDVFAYLLNVDTGEKQVVLDQTGALGSEETDWTTINATVETQGQYKLVFVSGAYDLSGGIQGFENADFDGSVAGSVTIPGWKTVNDQIILGTDVNNAVASPEDTSYPAGNGPLTDTNTPSTDNYQTVVVDNDSSGGSGNSASLTLSGSASSANAVIRGPAIYNETAIELSKDDVVSVDLKAVSGADQADIFAYLINEDTGETAEIVNQTGPSSDWVTASVLVPSDGNYRMVISAGSYDSNGDTQFGATLSVDNIQVDRKTPYANPDRKLGAVVLFDDLTVIPDTSQLSEINTNFRIDFGISESGQSEDFRVLGLNAKSYIDGVIEEDLLVFSTPTGGLGESGQIEMNLAYEVEDSFVPQQALRDAQFDIEIVQGASTGKQEQRSFVMSGVEEGSVLTLQVNQTTDPIKYTVVEADLGEDDEKTMLNALNNFVALINQASAMDRPDSQGGRIVAATDPEALALVLTSTTAVRTQMEIGTVGITGTGSFTAVTEQTIAEGTALGPLQRGEEPSEFGIYQIFDRDTRTILADRHYTENDQISYRGITVNFTDRPLENDVFRVDGNNLGDNGEFDAAGNNDTMIRLVRLESDTTVTGSGQTLGETYVGIVSALGNRSVQAVVSRDSMQAVFDQAIDARDNVSGVSLDAEAADLIRYQQAYQSSAQVMQTSVKLFDSILGIR